MIDEYLNPEASLDRLLREYDQHKSLVVAYDFDSTVYDFHKKGQTYSMLIELLCELKSIGCYLICFTANADREFITEYLKENNIPFDAINENPPFFKCEERKIYYNVLLDDRAGLLQTYFELGFLLKLVKQQKNENKTNTAD